MHIYIKRLLLTESLFTRTEALFQYQQQWCVLRGCSGVVVALTHRNWWYVVCFREEGPLCLFLHLVLHWASLLTYLQSCFLFKLGHLPHASTTTIPHILPNVLLWTEGKNAKPAQISVIISFTGAGLMSPGGPGFSYTKDREKREQNGRWGLR